MNDPTPTARIETVAAPVSGNGSGPPEAAPEAAPVTALAAALGSPSPSLRLREYRGARTVRAFSTPAEELAALLAQTGVYDLGWRSFLRVGGKDRVRWLNGMVTNSATGLEENAGCYAFVLNAQGRIQGDLNLYRPARQPDSLWLQTDRAQIGPLTAHFRRYIIMDQVMLEPEDGWTAIGVSGPNAAQTLARLELPGFEEAEPPAMHLAETTWHDHPLVLVAAHGPVVPHYELWIESQAALELWHALIDAGAVACGTEAIEHLRIVEGIPAYGADIADRDLPQETGQMRALNFTKGCYLGQEIVERIRSRGNVHRTLSGFQIEGEPPPAGTPILAEDKTVGDLTSIARVELPGLQERTLALGRIRRETVATNVALTADGKALRPCSLPFDFALPSP